MPTRTDLDKQPHLSQHYHPSLLQVKNEFQSNFLPSFSPLSPPDAGKSSSADGNRLCALQPCEKAESRVKRDSDPPDGPERASKLLTVLLHRG